MTKLHDAWRAQQRARAMRPNAHLWIRPDAHRFIRHDWKRFVRPGFEEPILALLEGKANFNPNQPRVPKGNPDGGQWTRVGGSGSPDDWDEDEDFTDGRAIDDRNDSDSGSESEEEDSSDDTESEADDSTGQEEYSELPTDFSASRIRYRIVGLPEPMLSQLGRLVDANARFDQAAQHIRRVDPTWRSQTESAYAPTSNEGIVRHAEARALEAEAHARRLGIGGNFGPPLEPPPFGTSVPTMRPFDGPGWINAYRTLANTNDLFGREVWSRDKGTVSVTEFNGAPIFGVNREAPTYTSTDLAAALSMRDTLIQKYPDAMRTENIGWKPNDFVFHAEVTVVLRAARANGGNLNDRTLEIHVDRPLCWSCGRVLPSLGRELGNPVVTYIHTGTGMRQTMWNGHWLD